MTRTRIAMMLPGAVSLGAYEGGALAVILAAVQAARGELAIDAMASASAGSITAVVASRALLQAADPFKLMAATWVELPALEHLETHDPISPLSMERLQEAAQGLLSSGQVPDGGDDVYRQDVPVHLSMALTALGGLAYRLPALRDTQEGEREALTMLATTNLDWKTAQFVPSGPPSQFLDAVDGALASGSTPVGFPPRLLDRSADHADYDERGFVNPGGDWHIWYSDGGDIDNEPFGRLLDVIDDASTDENDDRVIVLLQTQAPSTARNPKWFNPDPASTPTWTSTLMRVNHVQKDQNYYDDLRRLEKTNSRLAWLDTVIDSLDTVLTNLVGRLDVSNRADAENEIRTAMAAAAQTIDDDQQALRAALQGTPSAGRDAATTTPSDQVTTPPAAGAPDDRRLLLQSLLQRATGLHGKSRVLVEIISPAIDGDQRPAADKLSGEFLFHFGGFLDVRFRQSDFDLGARNAMTWLKEWLPGRVTDADAILAEVNKGFDGRGWPDKDLGDASLGKLTFKEDVQLARVVTHLLHVFEYGLRHDLRDR